MRERSGEGGWDGSEGGGVEVNRVRERADGMGVREGEWR